MVLSMRYGRRRCSGRRASVAVGGVAVMLATAVALPATASAQSDSPDATLNSRGQAISQDFTNPHSVRGEEQHAHLEIHNHTNNLMRLQGADLSWGKWGSSTPVDVQPHSHIDFDSMGRENSPSGTEGWASWKLEGWYTDTTITVRWNDPYTGSNDSSIDCQPPGAVELHGIGFPSSSSDVYADYTVGPVD